MFLLGTSNSSLREDEAGWLTSPVHENPCHEMEVYDYSHQVWNAPYIDLQAV